MALIAQGCWGQISKQTEDCCSDITERDLQGRPQVVQRCDYKAKVEGSKEGSRWEEEEKANQQGMPEEG